MKAVLRSLSIVIVTIALLAGCQAAPPAEDTSTPEPAVDLGPAPRFGAVVVSFGLPEGGSMDVSEVRPIGADADAYANYALNTTSQDGLTLSGFSPLNADSTVGNYRTAGADSTLTVFIDPTAEGLLLSARTDDGPLQVSVALDGETVTELHITGEWRLHYIPVNPIGLVTPSGAPLDWDVRGYFPIFPAAGRTYAFRVRSALEDWWGAPTRPDWRVSDSHETVEALTLTSLQGVVNRSDPSIYLDWEDLGRQGDATRFWIEPLREHIEVLYFDMEESSAVHFLLRRYADHFTGAVIYDPEIPDTINLATTLAGLEDRLMLAPQQLDHPGVQAFLARHDAEAANAYNLPTLDDHPSAVDLGALAEAQGWGTLSKLEQYQWLYDTLWPDLEQRGIAVLSPGPPTSELEAIEPGVYDPLGLAARDYFVALRMPVLWVSPTIPAERALFEQFLEDAPNPIPVFSFYDGQENDTVDLVSSYGNWVPVIPNSNTPLSSGSLSLLTAVRPEVLRYEREPDVDAILATLGQAPVTTLWNSDGDAMQILYDRGVPGGVQFVWDNVKDMQIGFSINPILADLTPLVWNHYLSTATQASFMSALSGAGYTSPQLMDADELHAFLERSAYFFELTGLRSIYMIELRGEFDGDLAAAYVDALEPHGYLGAFATFLGGQRGEVALSYPDDPHPVIRPTYIVAPGRGPGILNELLAGEPGELFYNIADTHFHAGRVIPDPDAASGQAVLFNRAEVGGCCMVVGGTNLTLPHGTYHATYRLKLSEKLGGGQIANIMVLQQTEGGINHANMPLNVGHFAQAGMYQEFTLSFTLTETTDNLELWIDYLGDEPGFASGDLIVDSIVVRREGGALMPRFAAIFIGLVGPVDSMDEDIRIVTEDFAAGGGIVLHPDDFAAALNPAFMLDLAEELLGADDPALDEARALLDAGEYYEALIAVRGALIAGLGE